MLQSTPKNMWPVALGIGAGVLLLRALLSEEEPKKERRKKKVFISFAIEDRSYRDFLVTQARNEKSPFSFTDMSVKSPWNEAEWKIKCKGRIKKCDGVIVLLSKNTWQSGGTRWEIKCARELRVPIIGMHIKKEDRGAIPPELDGGQVLTWTWKNLEKVIKQDF
jgi:hypothetical protein